MSISSTKAQLKNPRNIEFNWKTDTTKRIVALNEITVVVPPNTFPKIDYPKFIGKGDGLKEFLKQETLAC
jgi:hypothetical protein